MSVFTELLDDETRKAMAAAGHAPAIGPMENWLMNADLKADGDLVRSVLEVYLALYDKGDSPKILVRLRSKNDPEWARFLADNPMDQLRSACSYDLFRPH